MKINASIEARMTSTRFPGKVLCEIGGKPALQLMIERVLQSDTIDDIFVATTTNNTDDPIVELCEKLNIKYFRGSEENVYQRVLETHQFFKSDIIVELSGDCPLIDPQVIEKGLHIFLNNTFDYVHTSFNYPLGMATEIFSLETLRSISRERELTMADKEHVTPYLYTSGLYKTYQFEPNENEKMPEFSVTLDTLEDYEVIKSVYQHFNTNRFTVEQMVLFAKENPQIVTKNIHIKRKGLS
jgi:spore coat polysaccharide biosynthesis protein SpsF